MNVSASHCSVSWDLHKSHISNGFSHLQKNEEFVDMTIAAEGHLVKVHQNIIALASPYIKEMLHSASCPHPVVFLNNVNQRTLSYILEYIYTGEVKIPTDDMNDFIATAKELHIKGIENILPEDMPNKEFSPSAMCYDNTELEENDDLHQAQINKPIDSATCPSAFENNIKMYGSHVNQTDSYDTGNSDSIMNNEPETLNIKEKQSPQKNLLFIKPIAIKGGLNIKDITPQYTISNRGALQLILNRYMYLCHHHANGGRKRRWRCIDYRKLQCPAIVDTMDDNVTNRIGLHSHEFHDLKILKKFRKHDVFTTIHKAEEFKNADNEKS